MTVFEVLKTIEVLRFKKDFVDGESVSAANVFIFPPEDEGMDTTKMIEMMLIVFRTTFAESNFFQLLSWISWEQEAQT